ncbi:MAG: hypothetical protein J6L60_02050 [Bacteroidaceae bacterium]|nr:hypothetical protein [Bacteroidaceae bacterium]
MFQIICNIKGSRAMLVSETQLQTIERYNLLSDLLDSNGIVSEEVLDKLRLNVKSLLESNHNDADLVDLCSNVIFHKNMKAFGLHQLILLYIEWEKTQHEGEETTVEE